MTSDHLQRIRKAFERQSVTFDGVADSLDVRFEERFRDALGAAASGGILDVACGPGAVATALANGADHVVGLDATDAMLDRARMRARRAGLTNASFQVGDAEALPFDSGSFDGVVNRASLHHFANPGRAIAEMHRVLKPGGRVVVVDVISSDIPAESTLHNAIEILRDPSHVRMLPGSELVDLVGAAGFQNLQVAGWDSAREFGEWMSIANDAAISEPLRVVMRTLAESGHHAGIDLRVEQGEIRFVHRWRLIAADKP